MDPMEDIPLEWLEEMLAMEPGGAWPVINPTPLPEEQEIDQGPSIVLEEKNEGQPRERPQEVFGTTPCI